MWEIVIFYNNLSFELSTVLKVVKWWNCRGLTRAIYILCIEHLRMLHLSRELNPGPPALQASSL